MFFKTLHSTIQKELDETIYINEYYLEKKWNYFENKIVKWSKNPIIQSMFFTLFFLFLSILIYNLTYFKYVIPPYNLTWEKALEFRDLIFNGQLTILALIFPLVIGFVGILIKDDIANKSLWKIYSRYSGFMLVGFSGLSLIITMVLSSYFAPWMSENYQISLVLSFCIWFIFNLLLVSWLLHSTFNFIQIEKQNDILIKYTINIVVITEIKKRLFSLIPFNTETYGLIPKNDDDQKQKVSFYYLKKTHTDKIDKSFKRPMLEW